VVKRLGRALPKVMGDFDQLQQVCTNLILNAVQAMPEGGKLTLRTTADEKEIRIEVADTGQGMSREHIRKLFTPFFTTKGKGKGVGLGLAVAQGLVQHHQGRIEVKSEEGRGSSFTVVLPLHLERHEESAQSPSG
jgi:two-component system NtrC family sensor kinase